MPLQTTTTVVNGNPAQLQVVVRETSGAGGNVSFNVHVITNIRLATPFGQVPAPTDAKVKVTPTTVSWLERTIPQGGSLPLTARLVPVLPGSTNVCSTVVTIVTQHQSNGHYEVPRTVVCFA